MAEDFARFCSRVGVVLVDDRAVDQDILDP